MCGVGMTEPFMVVPETPLEDCGALGATILVNADGASVGTDPTTTPLLDDDCTSSVLIGTEAMSLG